MSEAPTVCFEECPITTSCKYTDKCSGPPGPDCPFIRLDLANAENQKLRALVVHCWVHSGYENCGYRYMDTEEKALYDAVTNRDEPESLDNQPRID